jgi:hypothetical protein
VFADPEVNMQLCTNARENAVDRFDPHMIAAAYDEQYHSVLSES